MGLLNIKAIFFFCFLRETNFCHVSVKVAERLIGFGLVKVNNLTSFSFLHVGFSVKICFLNLNFFNFIKE